MIACFLEDPVSLGIRSDVSKTWGTGEDPGYNTKKKDVFSSGNDVAECKPIRIFIYVFMLTRWYR
jgi:hypothetical protein